MFSFIFGGTNDWGIVNRFINVAVYVGISFQPYLHIRNLELPHLATKLTDVWFIEAEELLDAARVSAPNVRWVGGLTAQPPAPLPEKLNKFVESASAGFLLVAFGSKLSNLGKSINEKMVKVFGKLNRKVIWKVRSGYEGIDNLPDNVMPLSWVPQNDLLGHVNCRAVLLHCGNNGMYEALYHGVPMIGNPAIGDQPFNCKRLKNKGFGLTIDVRTDDVDKIYNTIKEVIDNPIYHRNIEKASAIRKSRMVSPVDEIVHTMELMMTYGTKHLKFPPSDLNIFQVILLDVLFVVAFIVICLIFIVKFFCKRLCCKNSKMMKLKKK
ncbi:UDP-glucuronosyltransferase 2A3-like [Tubulanus polymorphus]|uniref:UDP-glucuronosyltransferase 2A3-like n=1 Tax=Tubulanus polymorphus TaxID=672921 RepID=UPI003DA20AAC